MTETSHDKTLTKILIGCIIFILVAFTYVFSLEFGINYAKSQFNTASYGCVEDKDCKLFDVRRTLFRRCYWPVNTRNDLTRLEKIIKIYETVHYNPRQVVALWSDCIKDEPRLICTENQCR